jgi:hypothetical protein
MTVATWAFAVRRSTTLLDLKKEEPWTETILKLNCLRSKFLKLAPKLPIHATCQSICLW